MGIVQKTCVAAVLLASVTDAISGLPHLRDLAQQARRRLPSSDERKQDDVEKPFSNKTKEFHEQLVKEMQKMDEPTRLHHLYKPVERILESGDFKSERGKNVFMHLMQTLYGSQKKMREL